MNKLSENFSAALRRARGDRSQTEFAAIVGMSQPSYSRCEAGHIPDGEALYKIAVALGVTIDELMTGKPPGTSLTEAAMLREGVYYERSGPDIVISPHKKVTIGELLAELGKQLDSGVTPAEMLSRLKHSLAAYPKKKVSSKAKADAEKIALEVADMLAAKKNPAP